MADTKISALPAASALGGTEIVPGVQAAGNVGITAAQIKTFANVPGGSDTQVQFNDGGSFAGDADLVWNKTSNLLTINGNLKQNAGFWGSHGSGLWLASSGKLAFGGDLAGPYLKQGSDSDTLSVLNDSSTPGDLTLRSLTSTGGRVNFSSYTVATLPSAGAAAGAIYVSNAGGNGPCIAFSNGTNWKRCDNASTTVT